ncbi:MAG TPA: four helix bundle protein [Terriglobia bacterium]|nr:four helix bundle protein [Terriglobia bacterium]
MDEKKSQSDQLEERLIDFAVRIINLANSLPRSSSTRHIGMQVLRSGTSGAPNYAEARGAESRADFVHKLAVVHKELNETAVWLKILSRNVAEKREEIVAILAENQELGSIIGASLKTARSTTRPTSTNHKSSDHQS